jgi:hypothetical protein
MGCVGDYFGYNRYYIQCAVLVFTCIAPLCLVSRDRAFVTVRVGISMVFVAKTVVENHNAV